MAGRQDKTPSDSTALYAEAYSLQQGKYYPEHHQANVQRLHKLHPNWSLAEIDEIYRQACQIDFEVELQLGGATPTAQAREELLDWLEDHFHGFSRDTLIQAIERAEMKSGPP